MKKHLPSPSHRISLTSRSFPQTCLLCVVGRVRTRTVTRWLRRSLRQRQPPAARVQNQGASYCPRRQESAPMPLHHQQHLSLLRRVPLAPDKGLSHATIRRQGLTHTVITIGGGSQATRHTGELLGERTPLLKNPTDQRLVMLHRVPCTLSLQRDLLQARALAVPEAKVAQVGVQDLGAVAAGSGASGTGIARTGMSESSAVS